jgi:hypothetical protein
MAFGSSSVIGNSSSPLQSFLGSNTHPSRRFFGRTDAETPNGFDDDFSRDCNEDGGSAVRRPNEEMTFGAYMADIGLTYLIIPVVTSGLAAARAHGEVSERGTERML